MDLFKKLLEKRNLECSNLKQASKKDALKPFKVVIPHQIRAFVRETKGLLRGEKPVEAIDAVCVVGRLCIYCVGAVVVCILCVIYVLFIYVYVYACVAEFRYPSIYI